MKNLDSKVIYLMDDLLPVLPGDTENVFSSVEIDYFSDRHSQLINTVRLRFRNYE